MYAIYGNIYSTINIPPMLVYIPYMDPMGIGNIDLEETWNNGRFSTDARRKKKFVDVCRITLCTWGTYA